MNKTLLLLKRFLVANFILLSTVVCAQNALQQDLSKFYNEAENMQSAVLGMSVVDLKDEKEIVAINANKSLVPASIVKLYTTAATLHYLGADFTYKTYITYSGTVDNKGLLTGDVFVHGAGDPTLGSKYLTKNEGFLDTIVSMVKDAGITHISGDLVIDCSIFDSQAIPNSWEWADLGKSYAAGVYPIAINDNTFSISFSTPELQDTLQDTLQKKTKSAPVVVNASPFEQAMQGNNVEKDEKRGIFVVKGAIPAPQEIIGIELVQRFIEQGLFTYKQDYVPVFIPVRKKLDTLGVFESPSMFDIVEQTNHKSINNYAEHLCKYLGYSVYKDGSFAKGTEVVENYFDTLGIDAGFVSINDGSGLSRHNVTNANHMTAFLTKMYNDGGGVASDFFKSLPVASKTGTLKYYGFPAEMKGKIHAKTGSMTRVRNMAGYLITKSGKEVAFCIMLNGFSCTSSQSRALIVDMLTEIYNKY